MTKSPPKVVITGSAGLIGKRLVKHLSSRYEILPLDLKLGHDLTDEKFITSWFASHPGLYGLLVCHAANPVPISGGKKIPPSATPLSELRQYLEINVLSPYCLIKEFVKNSKNGRIILLSSIYGHLSPRHDLYQNFVKTPGYSISKGGLQLMAKYLATYYAPNFLINTVSFGGIADEKIDPAFKKRYEANIPVKRMMKVEETFPAIDFLLDPNNTYTTGADILTDGGWTAW